MTMSKRFKQRIVGLAAGIVTAIAYLPVANFHWAIYFAVCVGYSILVFGFAWSDGHSRLFSSDHARPRSTVVQVHLAYLCAVTGWIWFAQFVKPVLPRWVVAGGRGSWFMVFAGLGIVALVIAEQSWLSAMPKSDAPIAKNA